MRKESARPFRKISLFGRLQYILQVFEDGGAGHVRIAAMGRGRSKLHGTGAYKTSHTAHRRRSGGVHEGDCRGVVDLSPPIMAAINFKKRAENSVQNPVSGRSEQLRIHFSAEKISFVDS